MTAEEFLKQFHDNNPNDWLFQKRDVLAKLLKSYASQQRTEGIREGFDAARCIEYGEPIIDDGKRYATPFKKYPTADDYLNSKK